MAELLGVISAGVGLASFTLQVASTIDTLRKLKNGDVAKGLDELSGRLELLQQALNSLTACEEHPIVKAAVKHCQARYGCIEEAVTKLLGKFPSNPSGRKTRWKRVKLAVGSFDEEVRNIGQSITDVIMHLNLALQVSQFQLLTLHSEEAGQKLLANGDSGNPVVPTASTRVIHKASNSCTYGVRQCGCPCHRIGKSSGRFWSFEYTPLSIFLARPSTCECGFSRLHFNLRLAFSQYGISKAVTLGLDLVSCFSGYSLRPTLSVEHIVKYTSPGFETLWRLQNSLISLDEAKRRFAELYRSDPSFKYHRDPAGNSYVQKLICFGPWVGLSQEKQFALLDLFVGEFGMSLENEDQGFLVQCAGWIGEGWHLDLLYTILQYGFDPNTIDSPIFEDWPASCSPDWRWELGTPDPFFLQYIGTLMKDNLGFSGSTGLHNAILNATPESVGLWLSRTQPLEQNRNFLGQTPLHVSINTSHFKLVLEASNDLDVTDKWGTTPLMYAAATGRTSIVTLLISNGANPFLRDNYYKRNFLDYAFARGHWDLVINSLHTIETTHGEEIFQIFTKNAILIAICNSSAFDRENRFLSFSKLIEMCDDINFIFEDSRHGIKDNNLMHYVQSLEEAKLLSCVGFTGFNQANSKGNLAINSLAYRSDPSLIQYCLDHGTNVNHVNHKKQSILFDLLHGLGSDGMDSIKACLDAGIDVSVSDGCRCPCSPQGCDLSSTFKLGFSSFPSLKSAAEISPLWALEWSSLVEEHRGVEAARQTLLSLLRRVKCDEHEISITHVCCHYGRGINNRPCYGESHRVLKEEDITEILAEESEFICILEGEMAELAQEPLESLRSSWIYFLRRTYLNHLREVQDRNKGMSQSRVEHVNTNWHEYQVDYKNDYYTVSYDAMIGYVVAYPIFQHMAIYAVWLEHERSRGDTSLRNQHRGGWFDKRMSWFMELMDVMDVTADEIATKMAEIEVGRIRTKVDLKATVVSFLDHIRKQGKTSRVVGEQV